MNSLGQKQRGICVLWANQLKIELEKGAKYKKLKKTLSQTSGTVLYEKKNK